MMQKIHLLWMNKNGWILLVSWKPIDGVLWHRNKLQQTIYTGTWSCSGRLGLFLTWSHLKKYPLYIQDTLANARIRSYIDSVTSLNDTVKFTEKAYILGLRKVFWSQSCTGRTQRAKSTNPRTFQTRTE